MLLVTKWFGTFVCDDDGNVVGHKSFPKEFEAIAKRLERMEDGEILSEEKGLIKSVDLKNFSVFERRLERLGGVLVEERETDLSEHEYEKKLLHEAMIELSKRKMKSSVRDDEHVVQAIKTLDEQTHMINILVERLREWYGLHFPELEKMVSRKEFVTLVSEKGDRESIDMVEVFPAPLRPRRP